jgi:16S rRNA (uracil1498-N3)-methyltransferase
MAHRFYLPPDQCRGRALQLTGGEAHHALRVLRVRSGERVTVLDGAGHEFLCEVAGAEDDQVGLKILEKHSQRAPPWELTLLQALPKGKLIESIIQKAAELGAVRIVPLLSERVVVHLDATEGARKAEKWQAVAVEAIKQCGAAWLPRVELPVTPKEFLARDEGFELSLIGSLQPDARHPREYLQAFQRQHGRNPKSIGVWVGPEGDFTPGELQASQASGVKPITLGRLVLRADTAAMYCLSVLNYELNAPPVTRH